MARLRIFAGPNGSGKSTLFSQIKGDFNVGLFVNADLLQLKIAKSLLFDFNDYDIKVSAPEWKSFCGRHGLHDKTKFLDSSIVESNLLVFKAVPGSCNAIGLQVLYFR